MDPGSGFFLPRLKTVGRLSHVVVSIDLPGELSDCGFDPESSWKMIRRDLAQRRYADTRL
jgi:hypothetical protein